MAELQEVAHGRYLIRSWPLGQLWQARAFLNGNQVGDKHVTDDRESAVAGVKADLEGRDAEISAGRGPDGSPSALEYAEAFGRIRMSDGQEAMLKAHLDAPDHCITATQLADAAGYKNFNAANLKYGELGQALAIELNYNPPRRDDGSVIWTATIAWPDGDPDIQALDRAMERRLEDGHFEWIMRPQVVEALKGRR